jgi:hypothetical protein
MGDIINCAGSEGKIRGDTVGVMEHLQQQIVRVTTPVSEMLFAEGSGRPRMTTLVKARGSQR